MVELPKLSSGEIALGAGVTALGVGLATAAVVRNHRKKSRKRKTHKNQNSRKRTHRNKRRLKFGSKAFRKKYLNHGRRTPHTAGKRRDTSRRRIRYTSRGQPYIITSRGKARFISKKNAHSSYKRKGGKY